MPLCLCWHGDRMKNIGFNYKVFVKTELNQTLEIATMITWCEDTFGPRYSSVDGSQGRWACLWQKLQKMYGHVWYFKREEDAVFFTLRWMK